MIIIFLPGRRTIKINRCNQIFVYIIYIFDLYLYTQCQYIIFAGFPQGQFYIFSDSQKSKLKTKQEKQRQAQHP